MDGWPVTSHFKATTDARASSLGRRFTPATAPNLSALPSELAFWALWHCRHARPPDSCFFR
ncbi:hypothetical protein EI969_19745 [Pseudomonas sp. PB101]|jgi:hypothetical protein|nr:hypothetical protein [Pseudomonas sp. PB101]